jgi:hypothetical protein
MSHEEIYKNMNRQEKWIYDTQKKCCKTLDEIRQDKKILDTGGDRNFEIYTNGYIGKRK